MKIAQVAPLMESVPPRLYGGTERIVHFLTEELVRQGHDVTLFASGDSVSSATLVPCVEQAIRLNPAVRDPIPHYLVMLDRLRASANRFDMMHFHIDAFQMPLFRGMAHKTVTTLHGRQDLLDMHCLYREIPEMPLVSISDAQRAPIPDANIVKTIYHGLPVDLYSPTYDPRGGYLAFIGRISPEKRLDRAIDIACALGLPLKIAAKISETDEAYFREVIAPMLDRPGIEFLGEIGEREKGKFLGEALALLFPIDWPEPFGLVMIESMACGTPVLAFRSGSAPEVIDNGVTGYLVTSLDEAIRAVPRLLRLDRLGVRRQFEQRFSAQRMANDYLDVYRSVNRSVDTAPKLSALGRGSNIITLPRSLGADRHAN